MRARRLLPLIAAFALACGGEERPPLALPGELRLTEIASSNPGGGPGAARDELGEYDDWIELQNVSDHPVDLAGLWLSDQLDSPGRYKLPADPPVALAAGAFALIFADGEAHQGSKHLPFGLSKKGEALIVSTSTGGVVGQTRFPEMAPGESWAWQNGGFILCQTPTPGSANLCQDKTPPPKKVYAPYAWPEVYPAASTAPVVLSELDPFGDTVTSSTAWVELHNQSGSTVELSTLELRLAQIAPPSPVPSTPTGQSIPLSGSLPPGGYARVELAALPPDSGVLLLFGPGGARYGALAYESPEPGTVLARPASGAELFLACDALSATPGAANADCLPPQPRRTVPPMLRALGSLADLDAMAGPLDETTSDAASVKFIIDRQNDNTVYFVDSARWSLHFDWVWEVIQGQAPFDLCDDADRERHLAEWSDFSRQNYFIVDARRFYLGTLIHYRDSDLYTVEYAAGDRISPEQVKESFFGVAGAVWNGKQLSFRPSTSRLEGAALAIEGQAPIVSADLPFEGTQLQTLNPGVGYGVLEVVSAGEVETAPISYQSIVLLDRIPIDLPPVNGSITEEFQTPLSHVNVLAQNRGTPNMALRMGREDPRVAPFIGKLVRFEVGLNDFHFRVATATEAEAFWRERIGQRPPVTPPRDLSLRDIVSLEGLGLGDLPRIGAKAAQFAELINLEWPRFAAGTTPACALSGVDPLLPMPRPAFAIPFARYVEHLQRNGIDQEVEALLSTPAVLNDPLARKAALENIRAHIEAAPVDPELLRDLSQLFERHFGLDRVRFRSSTNVEDLPGFNGAGLYESHSAQAGSDLRAIQDSLRQVWSSVWTLRGFDERTLFGVDQRQVAMGVLVHRSFPNEEANGVAITRNVVAPDSHGFYINAQLGEISVVQPETGDLPEQLLYKMYTPPDIVVLARSTATGGAPVLNNAETHRLACVLQAIHNRFRALYADRIPAETFAVDVEWKVVGADRQVMVKQARPWTQASRPEPSGCHP